MASSFEEQYGVSFENAAHGLDEELKAKNEQGEVVACVGLFVTLYFAQGYTQETRLRVVELFERYRKEVGDQLTWGADPKSGKARKLQGAKAQTILDVRAWLPRLRESDYFEPAFQGGSGSADASATYFLAMARPARNEEERTELSFASFGLPFSWAAGKPAGSFLQLVLDACKIMRPAHGQAGLGIALPLTGSSSFLRPAVALAARFRGLELESPSDHSRELAKANAIKSINWLSVLSDQWLDKLGGLAALSATLGADIPIHRFEGGAIIQAGASARFGDVQRAEEMPAYLKVARALKPIRVERLYPLAKYQGFDEERTAKWLARFDEPLA
jgi:hypothetical protein